METTAKQLESLSATKRALVALKTLQAKHEALEKRCSEPIAIIGMGCRFPGGAASPAAFWHLLREGVDALVEVPPDRWDMEAYYDADPDAPGKMYIRHGGFLNDIDGFDARFFGISPREAVSMDPQQRLILEVCWEALENANQPPDRLYGSNAGVFLGISSFDYGLKLVGFGDYSRIDPYFGTGNSLCVAAGRLSYLLGLTGPCMSLDTACSSSLLAIHLASQSLRAGECDLAITGGVNLILEPGVNVSYCKARMLAADGRCKTFDAAADGYSRGEGCGMLVLKRLSRAQADGDLIVAVVRGSAVNQDGASGGLTVPSGPSQEKVLRQALASAAVQPHQVDYVEAHGTGTSLGDPIEVRALNAVYSQGRAANAPLLIGSVKTNIGHLEAAAGMAGVMKVVLGMQHQQIPPHLHFTTPNPLIPWQEMKIEVAAGGRAWPVADKPRLAGISAFGFGGTNVHVIIEEPPPPTKTAAPVMERPLHLVTLSAKTAKSLKALAERYIGFLTEQPEVLLADIAYSANTGRTHFSHRLSVVADSTARLRDRLSAFVEGREAIGLQAGEVLTARKNDIVFLFTGQGSQYLRMGAELYASQPTFRQILDRCDAILRPYLEKPLLEVLYPPAGERSPLDETGYTQPALFAVEYAVAELWQSWGIRPQVVMGHSMGEYVAACVAGVFSLEDGLRLIAERGRLMANLAGKGAMATVFADEARVSAVLPAYAGEVSVAAVNGPEVVVISGTPAAVEATLEALKGQGIRSISLNISHAFHSPMTEPVMAAFAQVASQISFSKPRLKLVSNVSGGIAGEEIASPDYWCRHLRQPVRFVESMRTLHREEYEIFVEIGPEPELLGLDQCLPEGIGADLSTPVAWLPSLRSGRNDWEQLLESLSTLYGRGVAVDWAGFDRDYRRRHLALPTYAFEHQHFWLTSNREPVSIDRIASAHSPMMAQLAAGKVEDLVEALTATGQFSAEERELLPRVCDLFARQLQFEDLAASVKDWFYSLTWQPRPSAAAAEGGEEAATGRWLILAEWADDMAETLAGTVRGWGRECVLVCPGERYAKEAEDRYILDPTDSRQMAMLFEELTDGRRPGPVVHLWGMGGAATDASLLSGTAMLQASHRVCSGLLHLCQQLLHFEGPEKPRLWVVTRGAATLGDGMAPSALAQAPLWGIGKIFGLEHPEYWGGLLDLAPRAAAAEAATLLREIGSNAGGEDQLCFRDGQRWVARLVPAELRAAAKPATVRADGTYLITGGQGPLGLRIAEQLVEQGARHLVLTGRREPAAKVLAAVDQLAAAGAKIRFLKADVADEAAMRQGLAEIEQAQWPPLRGVVHLAGIAGFQMIKELESETLRNVLHAKVAGAWLLHLLTLDLPLDFFICFSSIASVWGSIGQAHYAAANQFLDALVHFRHQQRRAALTINWGPWAEGGMTTAEAQNWLDRMGVKGMAPDRAIAAFTALFTSNAAQAVVADVDWAMFKAVYEARRYRPLLDAIEVDAATDTETPSAEAAAFLKELEGAPASERQRLLTTLILQLMAKVLWLEDTDLPDPKQGFFELGMDSITVIQMMTHLKAYLGRTIPPTVAFEYSSPDRLAGHLLTEVLQMDSAASPEKSDRRAGEDEQQLMADIRNLGEEDLRALIDGELNGLMQGN